MKPPVFPILTRHVLKNNESSNLIHQLRVVRVWHAWKLSAVNLVPIPTTAYG